MNSWQQDFLMIQGVVLSSAEDLNIKISMCAIPGLTWFACDSRMQPGSDGELEVAKYVGRASGRGL